MSVLLKSKETTFKKEERYAPRNKKEKKLVQAFAVIDSETDIAALLRDMLTSAEIAEFANRLEVAQLIKDGNSYKKISQQLAVSTATVSRVAHWLFRGCGGYWKVLQKIKE